MKKLLGIIVLSVLCAQTTPVRAIDIPCGGDDWPPCIVCPGPACQ